MKMTTETTTKMKAKMTTKDITLAAVLTAISMIITFIPFKIVIGPFTMTPASHVPTFVAMFLNPFVTLFTVIGSTIGFSITVGPLVALRAASHIIFALCGYTILKNGVTLKRIIVTVIVTGLLHAGAEAVLVYGLTGSLMPAALETKSLEAYTAFAFWGTLVQHIVDTAITIPVLMAIKKQIR